ncbi:hypothetical protein [Rugamonas fusca]|nr:hypothetical protein [Rugamonas fusca]
MRYLDDITQNVPSAVGINHQDKFVRGHALRRATLAIIYELMDVVRNPGSCVSFDVLPQPSNCWVAPTSFLAVALLTSSNYGKLVE